MKKTIKDLKLGDSLWYTTFFSGVSDIKYHVVKKIELTAPNACLINDMIHALLDRTMIVDHANNSYYLNNKDCYPDLIKNLEAEISITEMGLECSLKKLDERKVYLQTLKESL